MRNFGLIAGMFFLLIARPVGAESFQAEMLQASQKTSELVEEAKQKLGAGNLRTIELSRIANAKIAELDGVCTKKEGFWPFDRKVPVPCFAIRFEAYTLESGQEARIDRPLLATPFETRAEAENIIAQLRDIGNVVQEVSVKVLRNPASTAAAVGGDNGDRLVYLIFSMKVKLVFPGREPAVWVVSNYSFLDFEF